MSNDAESPVSSRAIRNRSCLEASRIQLPASLCIYSTQVQSLQGLVKNHARSAGRELRQSVNSSFGSSSMTGVGPPLEGKDEGCRTTTIACSATNPLKLSIIYCLHAPSLVQYGFRSCAGWDMSDFCNRLSLITSWIGGNMHGS